MSLEGKKAPDFLLEGSDAQQHALKQYAGKTVVIYFYPKDNTPGCTKEACGFRDNYKELTDSGVVVLGVSKDSIAAHSKFITNYSLPFVLLSDPDCSMMQAYEAYGEKVMCGKKSLGTIRSTVIIAPDGTVRKHWAKIAKAELHPDQGVAFLRG
jgi:peroxiredoxin Q/BCP